MDHISADETKNVALFCSTPKNMSKRERKDKPRDGSDLQEFFGQEPSGTTDIQNFQRARGQEISTESWVPDGIQPEDQAEIAERNARAGRGRLFAASTRRLLEILQEKENE